MASSKGKKNAKKSTNKNEVKDVNKSNDNIDKVKNVEVKDNKKDAEIIEEQLKNIEELFENKEENNDVKTEVKVRKVKKKAPKEEKKEEEPNSEELKEIMKSADEATVKTEKSNKKDDKVEDKTNTTVKKGTEIVKKDSVEILEKEIKEKKNKKTYRLLNLSLFLVFVMVFSTIFALINQGSNRIAKGITIKNIDVSNLTLEEAKTKVNEAIELEFMREADLYYTDEYTITLKPLQIEAAYDIENAVNSAYEYGREGNIIIDNYKILIAGITGKEIDMEFTYNEESLNSIVDDIASKVPGKVIDYNYSIEDEELIVTKGTKGVKVNTEKLKNDIIEEISSRKIEEILNNDENIVINIEVSEVEPEAIDINKLYADVYKEPVDAYYETEPFKLYPEEDGIDFAITLEEAAKIVADETQEEYIIPLKITKANKTVNDIGTEAFPYVISEYSTKYDASNTNRSQNLALAAEKINGTVLMPGEEFSYNQVVGKRTVEAGYKNAKIYSNGQVVDGLGGGICQISSTLYNAVLLADLEVTERRNHYFKTSYVPAGRDATVVWGSIDFKFVNTRTYPIKIEAKVSNGIAEFKIHGIKEDEEYDIKVLPVVTQTIPYSTQEVIDATLPSGTRKVKQSGSSGCKVTTYIEKSLNGKVVSKEAISSDTYRALTQIVNVGP